MAIYHKMEYENDWEKECLEKIKNECPQGRNPVILMTYPVRKEVAYTYILNKDCTKCGSNSVEFIRGTPDKIGAWFRCRKCGCNFEVRKEENVENCTVIT